MVDAIVLAGSEEYKPLKNVENKALITINGRPMIYYVIDSLKKSPSIERIAVVGPKTIEDLIGESVDTVLQPDKSIVENVKKGMDFLGGKNNIIVCTSDIPMISPEAIEDFIKRCTENNADIGYPIIEKSLNDSKYKDVRRTYVKLKDGIFTGGNILYINPSVMGKCQNIACYLTENRKNPFKMGRIFGPFIFIKLLLGILSIESIENKINKLLGINAKAIMTNYPEIGNDVDKQEDIDFVNRYINKQMTSSMRK